MKDFTCRQPGNNVAQNVLIEIVLIYLFDCFTSYNISVWMCSYMQIERILDFFGSFSKNMNHYSIMFFIFSERVRAYFQNILTESLFNLDVMAW